MRPLTERAEIDALPARRSAVSIENGGWRTDNLWLAQEQRGSKRANSLRVDRAGIEPATHGFSGRDKGKKLVFPASAGHFSPLFNPGVLVVC